MNPAEMIKEMIKSGVKYIKYPSTIMSNAVNKLVFPFGEYIVKEDDEYEWNFIARGYLLFEQRYKIPKESIELVKEFYIYTQSDDGFIISELKDRLENFIHKYSLMIDFKEE